MRSPAIARRLVLTFVGVAVVAASLTVLFLGMRDVMEIGGACGSGGPYVPVRPCPEGTWLVPVSIFTGIIAALVTAAATSGYVRGMAFLAWPALFLSLGGTSSSTACHLPTAAASPSGG